MCLRRSDCRANRAGQQEQPNGRSPVWVLLDTTNFHKSHYRHHTGTSQVGINTGILPACHMLCYCVDLINTGNLQAACRYYRHAGNVVMQFSISSLPVFGETASFAEQRWTHMSSVFLHTIVYFYMTDGTKLIT